MAQKRIMGRKGLSLFDFPVIKSTKETKDRDMVSIAKELNIGEDSPVFSILIFGFYGPGITRLILFISNFNEMAYYERAIEMDKQSYFFTKNHMWISVINGDMVRIGISDYGQSLLKGIVFINLPEAGEKLTEGERFADVETMKTVADLYSPVDGTVVSVNEALADNPEAIHTDPDESWLVEVRTDGPLPEGLMDFEAYQAYTGNY